MRVREKTRGNRMTEMLNFFSAEGKGRFEKCADMW